jgi:hypothetical protein
MAILSLSKAHLCSPLLHLLRLLPTIKWAQLLSVRLLPSRSGLLRESHALHRRKKAGCKAPCETQNQAVSDLLTSSSTCASAWWLIQEMPKLSLHSLAPARS